MPVEGRGLSSRRTQQVERDRRLGSLSTPTSVQKLQTALHAKAKAEAGYRFYVLYDKISREDVLAHAYAQRRSNKCAPGMDGQDVRAGAVAWRTGAYAQKGDLPTGTNQTRVHTESQRQTPAAGHLDFLGYTNGCTRREPDRPAWATGHQSFAGLRSGDGRLRAALSYLQQTAAQLPLETGSAVGLWQAEVRHHQPLIARIIAQTERRVLADEAVPASEKLVSLFGRIPTL